MKKLLAKLAAHKVITALVAVAVVAGGTAGGVVLNGGSNGNTCNGSCITSVPPGQQGTPTSTGATNNVCPVPGSHPKFIAIMLQGISSYVLANGNSTTGSTTFNPAAINYCASPNGQLPPNNPNAVIRSMSDGWLNYSYSNNGTGSLISNSYSFGANGQVNTPSGTMDGPSRVVPGAGVNTINELASAGGYVLPFSYNGASMTGTAAHPVFHFAAYDGNNVADEDPRYGSGDNGQGNGPAHLNAELQSIEKVFPNVPIVLIGHSNGGLIAEQWWIRYGTKPGVQDVYHIYTLDSPLNGVGNAGDCDNSVITDPGAALVGALINHLCGGFIGVSVAGAYQSIWDGNIGNVAGGGTGDNAEGMNAVVKLDSQHNNMLTAVGTYGDPLYDAGDHGRHGRDGILSQIMVNDSCLQNMSLQSPFSGNNSLTIPECAPLKMDFISPCDGGTYDQSQASSPAFPADRAYGPLLYGINSGSLYIHSEAKDCPGTIGMIMNLVRTLRPTAPTPINNKPHLPADAIAAWNATDGGCASTMAASLRHVADLLPSSDTTQIADLNQFAALPLAELGEGSQSQQAQGQADLTALNTFFGTDRELTTFTGPCSAAPPSTPPPTTPPPTLVTPGNGSPGDAVDGFYQSELNGDWAAACSYVTPSAQALCVAGTSGQAAATGNATVGTMVVSADGNEALVSVTGSICAPSAPCVSNSDASLGMPSSPSQFPADYQTAVANSTSDSSTSISPMPCSQMNGKWYVDFG